MPYKKKSRRSYRKKKSLVTLVKSMINKKIETKHKTYVASDWTNIGAITGTLTDMTDISQGVGDQQRVGNSLNVSKIYVQKLLRVRDNSSIPRSAVRILLVQSRGAPLTTSDMPNYSSPVDLDKMYVLVDRMINLSSNSQNASNGTYFGSNPYRLKINLTKGFKRALHYNDTATTATQNNIYLYMLDDTGYGQQTGFETIYYKDA